DVQQERVGVCAQLSDDERHAVLHQAADVVDVAGEPIELGADDRCLDLAGTFDRGIELRSVIVSTAFGLGIGLDQCEGFGRAGLGKRRLLRFEPEPAAALLLRRHADVSDCGLHSLSHVKRHRTVTCYDTWRYWSSALLQSYCCKTIRCEAASKKEAPAATGARAFGRTLGDSPAAGRKVSCETSSLDGSAPAFRSVSSSHSLAPARAISRHFFERALWVSAFRRFKMHASRSL